MSTVEFAHDPDSDARTGTDCHNLADNFHTVSLGQTGQHIKIGMTKVRDLQHERQLPRRDVSVSATRGEFGTAPRELRLSGAARGAIGPVPTGRGCVV